MILGYCSSDTPSVSVTEMFIEADDELFERVLGNYSNHVLQQ